MDKFSLITALCVYLRLAQGTGEIMGNEKWNFSGKALTETEIISKYSIGSEREHAGAFSSFRNGTLRKTGENIGMKLEDPNSKRCYLPREVRVYENLQKRADNLLDKGFANILDYGIYKNKRALILSLFGLNLVEYLEKEGMNFYEWEHLQTIATSVIDRLQFLHDAGYIHQDIKPDNFIYGVEDPKRVKQTTNVRVSLKNRIYMLDLGAAVRYRDENGTSYKQSKAGRVVSSPPYYSRTFIKRLTQSRRDDMESLGYTLLMCVGVTLPWHTSNNAAVITEGQKKICDDLEVVSVCRQSEVIDKSIQAAFSTYFILLKKLFAAEDGFYQEPDYAAFKKCFGDDPKGYYFNVTGKRFDDSKLGKLVRRLAKAVSGKSKH